MSKSSIETKRLNIYAASRDVMEGFIKLQTVEELARPYGVAQNASGYVQN